MQLYKINREYLELKRKIDDLIDDNGEVDENVNIEILMNQLNKIEMDRDVKLSNYAKMYLNLVAEKKAMENIIKRRKRQLDSLKRQSEWLKQTLDENIKPGFEFDDPEIKAQFIKSTKTVCFVDPMQLPDKYVNVKYSASLTLLKQLCKDQPENNYARLEESTSLIIKG